MSTAQYEAATCAYTRRYSASDQHPRFVCRLIKLLHPHTRADDKSRFRVIIVLWRALWHESRVEASRVEPRGANGKAICIRGATETSAEG